MPERTGLLRSEITSMCLPVPARRINMISSRTRNGFVWILRGCKAGLVMCCCPWSLQTECEGLHVFVCARSGKVRSEHKCSVHMLAVTHANDVQRVVHKWLDRPGRMLLPGVNRAWQCAHVNIQFLFTASPSCYSVTRSSPFTHAPHEVPNVCFSSNFCWWQETRIARPAESRLYLNGGRNDCAAFTWEQCS